MSSSAAKRIRFVSVEALNLRKHPSKESQILSRLDRGERVELLATKGEWSQVRTEVGKGWVASKYLSNTVARSTGAAIKSSPGSKCPPDRSFRFSKPPLLSVSKGDAHGLVTVEASVNMEGVVTGSRVVANTTGNESLGRVAQKELEAAIFDPPIRNCRPSPFIYTYKRAY